MFNNIKNNISKLSTQFYGKGYYQQKKNEVAERAAELVFWPLGLAFAASLFVAMVTGDRDVFVCTIGLLVFWVVWPLAISDLIRRMKWSPLFKRVLLPREILVRAWRIAEDSAVEVDYETAHLVDYGPDDRYCYEPPYQPAPQWANYLGERLVPKPVGDSPRDRKRYEHSCSRKAFVLSEFVKALSFTDWEN